MKINKLILSGYKRLLLNNIRTITFTPTSIYQLILGTNGSGKSSILHELSPLPSFSGNYIKGGYKQIEITHNGDEYVLVSTFKSGNKHSFLKNGEELNPGQTGAVQKDLVQMTFGITPDIHELLTGGQHFTDMSPAKRREWITKLCDTDFTYAIKVHQQLRSSGRDAQGAIKHLKGRVSTETNKLQALTDIENLEERYTRLHKELNHLFLERDNSSGDFNRLDNEFEETLSQIDRLSRDIVVRVPQLPKGKRYGCLEDVEKDLNDLSTEIKVSESLRTRIAGEYEELSGILTNLKDSGGESIDQLKDKQRKYHQERDETTNTLVVYQTLQAEASVALRAFYEASTAIYQTLQDLPANPDRKFTRQKLSEAKEKHPIAAQEVERCQNRLAQIEARLEHILSLKETECPSCEYRWVPGASESDKQKLENAIKQGKEKLVGLQKEERSLRGYIEDAEEYAQRYGGLRVLSNEYPRLVDLWGSLLESPELLTDPASLIPQVNAYQKDLEKHVKIEELTNKIDRLERIFTEAKEVGQIDGIHQRVNGLTGQLEDVTQKLIKLKEEHQLIQRYHRQMKDYLDNYERLNSRLTTIEDLFNELIRALRSEELEKVIHSHQNHLGVLQSKRTEKQSIENILKDLESSQKALEIDHEAYALLADELSPVDGLIAEQLTGFIESFVAHINQVIQNIWTYDLRVLPCGLDGGDLDYKFPLFVKHEGQDNTAPDIGKGSEAQVEVVNLAFRLVAMVYLGLEEYPVYLDEIGRSFDEQHRSNVMAFIKKLVDTGNYTQLFLVSHYAAQYGAFTQSEILVLDGSNVSVPKGHNKHAILE